MFRNRGAYRMKAAKTNARINAATAIANDNRQMARHIDHQCRQPRRPDSFLCFNLFRSNDIFSGQFTKLCLHFGVADLAGVPPTFVGLIPQIDGAWEHG
jgi:hypothetical protein